MRTNQNRNGKGFFTEHWQPSEEALLSKLWADHSIREIAPMFPNYTMSAIRAKANHLGLQKDFEAKRARGVRNMTSKRRKALLFDPDFTKQPKRAVLAYTPDGIKEFKNAKEAALYYGLKLQRVYDLIATAETTYSEIGFDYLAL